MHHLHIDAQFSVEDAWQLDNPASDEVFKSEPMLKSIIDLASVPQYVELIVALQQVGLLEWARSTAYDELWTYLKSFFHAIPKNQLEVTASLEIKDSNGKQRVSIDGITPSQLSNVRVRLKEKIEVRADGSSSEDRIIDISLK